jgi:RHS repeat-associated protein
VYTFDPAGRLTNQTVNLEPRTYLYDFRSQMTSLTDTNSATGAYAFDGDGARVVSAVPGGGSLRHVYDGPNVVLDLTNGVVLAAYVNGLGIDQPIERIQFISGVADGRHVYHTDALGSVWAMTDDLQVTAKAYTYEAFGKIRAESGTGLLFLNRYTYTARESIGDSLVLYYYRWRVMDPSTGRLTSEDPLGVAGGQMNAYSYVSNNPLVFNDPFGLYGNPVSGMQGPVGPSNPFDADEYHQSGWPLAFSSCIDRCVMAQGGREALWALAFSSPFIPFKSPITKTQFGSQNPYTTIASLFVRFVLEEPGLAQALRPLSKFAFPIAGFSAGYLLGRYVACSDDCYQDPCSH